MAYAARSPSSREQAVRPPRSSGRGLGGRLARCSRPARRTDPDGPGNARGNPDPQLGHARIRCRSPVVCRRLGHGRFPGGTGGRGGPAAATLQHRRRGHRRRVRAHPHEPRQRTRLLHRHRRVGPRMAGDAVSRLGRGRLAGHGRFTAHGAGAPGARQRRLPAGARGNPGRRQPGRERHDHRYRHEPFQSRREQLGAGPVGRLVGTGGRQPHQARGSADGRCGRRPHLHGRLRRLR